MTRLPVLASQVPLVLRRTPEAVYVVGGAAGPIGGDELALRISVEEGAFLRVRTAAASIALPGPDGLESVLRLSVAVGPGACLEYLPEPVVVAAGARHATVVSVSLDEGASLLLRDELLLGRHGEDGGAGRTVLRVDYAGRPLLRQSLEVSGTDDASLGPAMLAGHRAVGTLLHVSPALDTRPAGPVVPMDIPVASGPETTTGQAGCAAVLRLAGPGILVTALARDAVTLRKRLALPRLRVALQQPPGVRLSAMSLRWVFTRPVLPVVAGHGLRSGPFAQPTVFAYLPDKMKRFSSPENVREVCKVEKASGRYAPGRSGAG